MCRQDFIFNNGAFDLDVNSTGGLSDSLTFGWAVPLMGAGTPAGYNGSYSYNKPFYFLGFPNGHPAISGRDTP